MADKDDSSIIQNPVTYRFGDLPDDGVALLLAYATTPEKLSRREMESFVIGMTRQRGDRAWERAGSARFRCARP